jgi:DHA1 family tetracycline resistance protein-like MFS transporter
MPNVSRKTLCTVYVVMLMDTFNLGMIFPLLPSIAKDFGASGTVVGGMASAYSFCQMLTTPVLGWASDRFGRRPIILLALLGTTFTSWATGAAGTLRVLFASRCLSGISGSSQGVVSAYVADVTVEGEERNVYMSYLSAANSIGIVAGPAVGGLMAHVGFSSACYVSAALSGLNLLAAAAFVHESRWRQAEGSAPLNEAFPEARGAQDGGAEGNGEASADEPLPVPNGIPCKAGFLFAAGFLMRFGFASVESIAGYYLMDTYFDGDDKASARFFGMCMVLVGFLMFLCAGILYKPLLSRFGERTLVVHGAALRAGAFALQSLAPSQWWFAVAFMLVGAGTMFTFPTIQSSLTKMCDKSIYGRALGVLQSFQALGRTSAPILFGWLYDRVDHRICFFICSGLTVAAGVMMMPLPMSRPSGRGAAPGSEAAAY